MKSLLRDETFIDRLKQATAQGFAKAIGQNALWGMHTGHSGEGSRALRLPPTE